VRTNLQVPFAEKEEAKKLGARWDPARKVWYVENKPDLTAFGKWITGNTVTAASSSLPKQPANQVTAMAGITVVGSNYAPQPRICECLPWDDCDRCRVHR
jgi:hypothetical protein